MSQAKLNETKADKEPLGKKFWFLWLPWFVLLLLIVLINVYQKEGIIHQDDLGNTVFSKVKTAFGCVPEGICKFVGPSTVSTSIVSPRIACKYRYKLNGTLKNAS